MKGLSTEQNVHKSMNRVHDLATLLLALSRPTVIAHAHLIA